MKFIYYIGLYEEPPAFYRPAWFDIFRRRAVYFPFGIHWIAMFLRWLWEKSFCFRKSRLERLLAEAERAGFNRCLKNIEEKGER